MCILQFYCLLSGKYFIILFTDLNKEKYNPKVLLLENTVYFYTVVSFQSKVWL